MRISRAIPLGSAYIQFIVGFLARRSGGWETLHAPASETARENPSNPFLSMAAYCFGRDRVVHARGGVWLRRNFVTGPLSDRARSLLFTLMWAGFALAAWLIVTHA